MATYTFNAVIYGGTAAGIVAAKRLADAGYSVAILEWTKFTGGMVTGGLGLPDYVGNTDWGLTRTFFERIEVAAIASGATSATYGYHPNGLIRRYAPDWARYARDQYLSAPGITVVTDIEMVGVTKDSTSKTIQSVTLSNGNIYQATQFMDASYEGDLLRLAGVPMDYGRNSMDSFNEINAGFRADHYASNPNQRRVNSRGDTWDYYTMPPRNQTTGSADAKTQGYDFRMTLSTESTRRVFAPPPNFNPNDFEDWIDETNVRGMSTIEAIASYQLIANDLYTTNGNDWHGRAWRYPRLLTKAARVREANAYFYRHMGQYYVAMTDTRVPSALRTNIAAHGLPAAQNTTEYIGTPGWSSALYTREVNRMRTEKILTFTDMISPGRQSKPDPIAIAGYNGDRHYVNYFATPTGGFNAEGGFDDTGRSYYQIPFSACRPSPRHCTNVVTPISLAASSVFIASYRMEPSYMVTGESLGIAMVASIEKGVPVGLLDYSILRERLINANAVITY